MSSTHCAVIAAFPATGKTYLASNDHRFSDSDSSRFSWGTPGVRNPNWPNNYISHIKGLLADGQRVLCSTHLEVRDALAAAEVPFTLAYPHEGYRDEYIDRMRRRGSPEPTIAFVESGWFELLDSCRRQRGCAHVVLYDGQYLSDVVGGLACRI